MNAQDHSDQPEAERIGELLCGYLLGELDDAQRAEVEAALENSEELRAERTRLAATIGVVRDAFPAERLSPEAMSRLMSDASQQRPIPPGWSFLRGGFLGGGLVRVAAAVLVLVGAGFAVKAFLGGNDEPLVREKVATLDGESHRDRQARIRKDASTDSRGTPTRSADGSTLASDTAAIAPEAEIGFDTQYKMVAEPSVDKAGVAEAESFGVEAQVAGGELVVDEAKGVVEAERAMREQLRALGYEGPSVDREESATSDIEDLTDRDVEPLQQLEGAMAQDLISDQPDQSTTLHLGFEPKKTEAPELTAKAPVATTGGLVASGPASPGPVTPGSRASGRPGSPGPAGPGTPGPTGPSTPGAAGPTTPAPKGGGATSGGGQFRGPGDTVPPQGGALPAEDPMDSPAVAERPRARFATEAEGLAEVKEQLQDRLVRRILSREAAGEEAVELDEALLGGYLGEDVDEETNGVTGSDGFFLGRGERKDSGRRVVELTPEEIEEVCDQVLAECAPLPNERPTDMFFRFWGDNAFEFTADDAQSTFAADVDTASYTLARRYLNGGHLPEKAQIRTEEFVNYFHADHPAPVGDAVFDLFVEMAPSLFHPDPAVEMLRVTVRGKDIDKIERQPLALTFVVDVSGSMNDGGRISLVQHALELLVRELDSNDAIALITFSEEAKVVSSMVSASPRGPLEDTIAGLTADGGTNIEAGLTAGYQLASDALTPHAVNRVILLSDGVGNIGETDQMRILDTVAEHQAKGIYLNTIGVGMGNHNDAFLEQLANKGDGVCNFIDSEREAERVMVDDFTKTLQPIARDVKIQVEFDPAQVESYRQLGYENRAIADIDFRNDAVDAGEVNAGHQVTALYEIVRLPARTDTGVPLARVNLRYKPQNPIDAGETTRAARTWAEQATEINRDFFANEAASSYDGARAGYRRAVLVAQFAEFLRRSKHAEHDSFDALVLEAKRLNDQLHDPDFAEFCLLLEKARPLLEAASAGEIGEIGEIDRRLDALRRGHFEATRAPHVVRYRTDRGAGEQAPNEGGDHGRERIRLLEEEVRSELRRVLGPPPAAEPKEDEAGEGDSPFTYKVF